MPEGPESTLGQIDREVTENLAEFLRDHIVATEMDLDLIEKDFSEYTIPDRPSFVSDYTNFLMEKLVAQSVHTAAPGFIGHMTTALPHFMLPLSRIMTALNQNLVKIETSKAFTPMERQVLGKLHNLIYSREEAFYTSWMHNANAALGAFCSGGTVANITALWVARNNLFPATKGFKGVAQEGLHRALKYYDCDDVAILISRRGHYSFGKTADLLGIGRQSIHSIPLDDDNHIDLKALRETCNLLQNKGVRLLSIIGIAGTTETGHVDPLDAMADIAEEYGTHLHVDAAWGGPTLFSETHKPLLKGIERADSVTMDGHKQLYVPMGSGMVLFKNPASLSNIEHHAEYILRKGSKDLGSHTLEGSRPGVAMLVHAAMEIIGREGYELLIDQGIEKAQLFASLIDAHKDFELVTSPELNLMTYRYVPEWLQQVLASTDEKTAVKINKKLSKLIRHVQKLQRSAGKTFVSRTTLDIAKYHGDKLTVFRVVIANPLTRPETLAEILLEQQQIAESSERVQNLLSKMKKYRS